MVKPASDERSATYVLGRRTCFHLGGVTREFWQFSGIRSSLVSTAAIPGCWSAARIRPSSEIAALDSFSPSMGRMWAARDSAGWKQIGGRQEARTPDLRVANAALSQLS